MKRSGIRVLLLALTLANLSAPVYPPRQLFGQTEAKHSRELQCVAGARWVQEEVLAKHPSAPLRVYAVWFNMVGGDKRANWPSGLFSDSRVTDFWDEEKFLGRWFGHHPEYLNEDEILWDTYLLYGPESRWSDRPSDKVSWGYTIMRTREQMRRDLAGLLRK